MSRPPLSIIIPTYNAVPRLGDCLAALVEGLGSGLVREAIVVDGGSEDASVALAADMGCTVVALPATQRGRGQQLAAGARAASGDWLMFLHADSVLEAGWSAAVARHIENHNQTKAAYFQLAFSGGDAAARRVAGLANWRAGTLGLPYGDAGIVIARAHYDRLGGYQALPLMEDVDLVRRIGARNLVGLDSVAVTSPAKFEQGGWWRVPLRNIALVGAYVLGVSPARLAKWYR
jgi:rSAM/selenodomain-associated transferase 2